MERILAGKSKWHLPNKSADGTTLSRGVHLKIIIVVRVVTKFAAFYVIRMFISKKSHPQPEKQSRAIIRIHFTIIHSYTPPSDHVYNNLPFPQTPFAPISFSLI